MRRPLETKDRFAEWLAARCPDRAERVQKLIRDSHGGKRHDATFGARMRGTGACAARIARRFEVAARRLGLDRRVPPLDCSRFRPGAGPGGQRSLF